MGYPSTAALVAASTNEALGELTTEQQDALRSSAILGVEDFCRQSFTPEGTAMDPITKAVDGSGNRSLYLPKRLAVAAGLSVDGAISGDTDFELSEKHDFIRLVSPLGGTWVTRVRRHPWEGDPVFGPGDGNVLVSGIWGWTDDEWDAGALDAVTVALRYDMEDAATAQGSQLSPVVRDARALGISSISQGGLSLTLSSKGGSGAMISVRCQRLLASLRWRLGVGSVA